MWLLVGGTVSVFGGLDPAGTPGQVRGRVRERSPPSQPVPISARSHTASAYRPDHDVDMGDASRSSTSASRFPHIATRAEHSSHHRLFVWWCLGDALYHHVGSSSTDRGRRSSVPRPTASRMRLKAPWRMARYAVSFANSSMSSTSS
jgi:hypothetical protein